MFYSCLSGLPQTTGIQTQIIQLMKACHEAFPRKGDPPLIVALCLATPNCTFSAIMRHGPRGLCAGTAEARSSTSTASSWDGKRPGTGNPSKGTSQRLCFGGPESFLGRTDATAPKPGRRIISDKEPMGPGFTVTGCRIPVVFFSSCPVPSLVSKTESQVLLCGPMVEPHGTKGFVSNGYLGNVVY